MRPRLAAASIALLGLACATAQAKDTDLPLPRGWHKMPLERYKGTYNWDMRKSLPNGGLEVRGDFKGNGHVEVARILERKRHSYCAVDFTEMSGRHAVHVIYEGVPMSSCTRATVADLYPAPAADLYVAPEPPAENIKVTFCNSWTYCNFDTHPYTARLVRPGFRYGYLGTHHSIVFWDDKTRSWASATLAD